MAGRLRLNLDVPALRPLAAAAIPNPTSRTLIDRKIEVTGTADDPLAVGSIEFHRGFLTLLDRRFSIDQGTITFSGAKPPIPEIDIKASAGASGELQGHRPDHRAGD